MPTAPQQRIRALNPLKNRSMLRLNDSIAEGIGPETLTGLVLDDAIVRPAAASASRSVSGHAARAFAEATTLAPKGVICLISALQFHELNLQTPSAVWMTIARTALRPKVDCPPTPIDPLCSRGTGPMLPIHIHTKKKIAKCPYFKLGPCLLSVDLRRRVRECIRSHGSLLAAAHTFWPASPHSDRCSHTPARHAYHREADATALHTAEAYPSRKSASPEIAYQAWHHRSSHRCNCRSR